MALLILVAAGALYGFFGRAGETGRTPGRKHRSALLENDPRAIADGERRADRQRWDPDHFAHDAAPIRAAAIEKANANTIPANGKTVSLGSSPTIASQNVPAPVATAAGMSRAAQAIGNQ